MRLYWGRSEPRITSLTLKIMGMNVVALIMLLLGVLYLGQYQNELIEAKLETFNAKAELITAAILETTLVETDSEPWKNYTTEPQENFEISETKIKRLTRRFGSMTDQRIYIFNKQGQLDCRFYKNRWSFMEK